MVARPIYRSRLKNRYGEEWEFEYDAARQEGVLRGEDIDWHEYPVLDGQVPGLVLNDEEIHWLRHAWEAATAAHKID